MTHSTYLIISLVFDLIVAGLISWAAFRDAKPVLSALPFSFPSWEQRWPISASCFGLVSQATLTLSMYGPR